MVMSFGSYSLDKMYILQYLTTRLWCNLSLTERLQCRQNRDSGLEIELPRRPARGDFRVLAPLLGVEILIDVGGGPDLFGISRAMMERERQKRRTRQRGHDMQRRDRPGIMRQRVACGRERRLRRGRMA